MIVRNRKDLSVFENKNVLFLPTHWFNLHHIGLFSFFFYWYFELHRNFVKYSPYFWNYNFSLVREKLCSFLCQINQCVIQSNYYDIRQYQTLLWTCLASAHFQCVNNHYAKFEYKGIKSVWITDYTQIAQWKHSAGGVDLIMSKSNTPNILSSAHKI